jgi:hypothetical protein
MIEQRTMAEIFSVVKTRLFNLLTIMQRIPCPLFPDGSLPLSKEGFPLLFQTAPVFFTTALQAKIPFTFLVPISFTSIHQHGSAVFDRCHRVSNVVGLAQYQ